MKIEIIEETKEYIVCVKPANLAVETNRPQEEDVGSLLRKQTGAPVFLVHRLDQPVEGLLVVAKTPGEAARLSKQFRENLVNKEYLAKVRPETEEIENKGCLADYLLRDGKKNVSRIVPKDTDGAKRAELFYTVLKKEEGAVLLKVKLMTGRHHQIRVQLSGAGMPIFGDRKYGGPEEEHLCLCAYHLRFERADGSIADFEIIPTWQKEIS